MRFISWNVNGFRAVLTKGFAQIFSELDADFFCLQETKMQPGQADFSPDGYHSYWFSAQKKGYSGTAVFTKNEPISVSYGIDGKHTDEGRVITLEYAEFYLVCAYVPNAQDGLKRIDYRMEFEDDMRVYLSALDKKKAVIYCGDLNVAHRDYDLANPQTNHYNPGFTDEERGRFTTLLNVGFIDTFRHFYPDQRNIYSWWSYRFQARQKNVGWRIDYFLASENMRDRLSGAAIHTEIFGSDHCPVELTIE